MISGFAQITAVTVGFSYVQVFFLSLNAAELWCFYWQTQWFDFQYATALLWVFTRSVECCLSRISDEPPIKPLIHQLLWRVFFQMVTVCWIRLVWWICWKPCSAASDYCCSAEPRTDAMAMLPWWRPGLRGAVMRGWNHRARWRRW